MALYLFGLAGWKVPTNLKALGPSEIQTKELSLTGQSKLNFIALEEEKRMEKIKKDMA